MAGGELVGAGDEVEGELADEDGGGLEVDALVLEAHDDGPGGVVDADGEGPRAVEDHVLDDGVHLAAVLGDAAHLGPLHVVFAEVVPRHLVDAGLHDLFDVGVDSLPTEDHPGENIHQQEWTPNKSASLPVKCLQ